MKVTEYNIINKKSIFIIENNNIKFYAIEIYNNGHEIICYGNNTLIMLFDDSNNVYYDPATNKECNGEITYRGVIIDDCIISSYDNFLNEIKRND